MAYKYFAGVSTMGRKINEQIPSANCALISEVRLHVDRREVQLKAPQNEAVHVPTGAPSSAANTEARATGAIITLPP